jgi:hypothetical protein
VHIVAAAVAAAASASACTLLVLSVRSVPLGSTYAPMTSTAAIDLHLHSVFCTALAATGSVEVVLCLPTHH